MPSCTAFAPAPAPASRRPRCLPSGRRGRPARAFIRVFARGSRAVAGGGCEGWTVPTEGGGGRRPPLRARGGYEDGRRAQARRHFPSLRTLVAVGEGSAAGRPAGVRSRGRRVVSWGRGRRRRRRRGGGWAPRGAVGWPQPPSASRPAPHGPGGGVILHILHPAPPPASIKLGRGKSRPRAAPIGRRRLPLWRDWLWGQPGPPDVISAIRFVGRGDLGLGGWDAGGKVGSAGGGPARAGAGGPWAGSLPLIRPAERSLRSRAAVLRAPPRRPSLAGERGGRREEVGSRGTDSCAATRAPAGGRSPGAGPLAPHAG